MSVAPVSSDP